MTTSHAGPTDGVENPVDVNIINIHEHEDTHGSPMGEPGVIVLWDGNEYDSETSWIQCHSDNICELDSYL